MNTLTPPDLGEYHAGNDPAIRAELFPGTEFTLESEQNRVAEWHKTGECTGPTHIGMIDITPEAIEVLKQESPFDFRNLDYDYFSADQEEASYAAVRDKLPPLSEKARTYFRELFESFLDLTEQDIQRSDLADSYERGTTYLYAGTYVADDEPHTDSADDFTPRYIVTIVGPSTPFYTGVVNPKDFSVDGEYELDTPLENPTVSSGTNVLDRFAADCDPHNVPTEGDGEYRITLITQFTPKARGPYQSL